MLIGSGLKTDWKILAMCSGLFKTNLRSLKFILKVMGIHWVDEIDKKTHKQFFSYDLCFLIFIQC